MIYLDNNATTMPDPAVREAMLPFLAEAAYANPSSTHRFGQEARQAVEEARRKLALLLACDPKDILFTSGGTESDNAGLWGLLLARGWTPGNPAARRAVITSSVEHSAIREPLAALNKLGVETIRINVDQSGALDMNQLAQTLSARTQEIALVSIMWANNETGILFDIPAIGALCRENGVLFHCDAVQAFGKVPLHVDRDQIDLMSLSAHKMYGPKGIGALYVRRRKPAAPLTAQIDGGGHESGFRSGTLNVPAIVGFGEACRLSALEMEIESARLGTLRDRLLALLKAGLEGVTVNGTMQQRLPNNLNVTFAGVDAESLLIALPDIALSTGSACTSATVEPSHVLQALGMDRRHAQSSVRFGLGRFNTAEEIDQAAALIIQAGNRIRSLGLTGWE